MGSVSVLCPRGPRQRFGKTQVILPNGGGRRSLQEELRLGSIR
jgi:hypothetical protein